MKLLGLLMSTVTVSFNRAGLVCFMFGPWALHFFVKPSCWQWWYVEDWYDGPLPSWGLGPFFLLCGFDTWAWCHYCDAYECRDRPRHRG